MRTCKNAVNMTVAEYQEVEKAAKALGMTVAGYIRYATLTIVQEQRKPICCRTCVFFRADDSMCICASAPTFQRRIDERGKFYCANYMDYLPEEEEEEGVNNETQ